MEYLKLEVVQNSRVVKHFLPDDGTHTPASIHILRSPLHAPQSCICVLMFYSRWVRIIILEVTAQIRVMQAPPKFSSFVKKPASSAPTPEEGPNAGNARRQHDSRDDRRSHRRRLQDQQQSRRRDAKEEHGLRLKKASPADTPYNWSTTAKQEPPLGNDLYVVDIKGDAGNTTYDGPDKASIPAYRPVPERRAIGYRVVRPPPAKSLLSTLSRNERTRLRQIDPQLKSMSEAAASRNIERDFISLAAGTKRRRLGQQDPHLPTDDLSEGTGSESERSSEDVVPDGVSKSLNSWDGHDLSEAKAENARLSRLVQLHPQDAQAWQVFIDYQEKWMEASPTHQGPRAASSRAIADLRISLYTDALAKLGETHPARASFILKLLEEGGKVWERAKLMDRWEDTIMREADSVEVSLKPCSGSRGMSYSFIIYYTLPSPYQSR